MATKREIDLYKSYPEGALEDVINAYLNTKVPEITNDYRDEILPHLIGEMMQRNISREEDFYSNGDLI